MQRGIWACQIAAESSEVVRQGVPIQVFPKSVICAVAQLGSTGPCEASMTDEIVQSPAQLSTFVELSCS
jgi:hypothetical protein